MKRTFRLLASSSDLTLIVQLALVAVSGDVIKQSPDPYLARLPSHWDGAGGSQVPFGEVDNCISLNITCIEPQHSVTYATTNLRVVNSTIATGTPPSLWAHPRFGLGGALASLPA